MRTELRFRVAVAGAELRMLVLASEERGCVGVDVDSGAFVRADYPASGSSDPASRLSPLDLVSAPLGPPVDPPDPARPEAVSLESAPRRVGRFSSRRASRYLQPLVHPPQPPLLGFAGACTPYWMISGDRPSLALVAPDGSPELRRTSEPDEPAAWECQFNWLGSRYRFPVRSPRLTARLEQAGRRRTGGRDLARILGYPADRLLVVLGPPVDGYTCKEVAALLPA